ncbi:MAG: ATP-binding protein [Labilibaculum sp.]|nr:ATP-binding protein [Labilibaculum sp.]MBI9056811.1 ATP-binding protein [Labilibaculum sp.]
MDNSNDTILELNQINLFIGSNNSGKSRLTREVFKSFTNCRLDDLPFGGLNENSIRFYLTPNDDLFSYFTEFSKSIQSKLSNENAIGKLTEQKTIFENTLKNKECDFVSENEIHKVIQFVEKIFAKVLYIEYPKLQYTNESKFPKEIRGVFNELKKILLDFRQKVIARIPKNNQVFRTTFIPPHRSLRKFGSFKIEEDKYSFSEEHKITGFDYYNNETLKERVCFDYFIEEIENIFTGEDLFDKIKVLRNSKEEERQKLIDFECFLSKNFFNNQKVEINALTHNNEDEIYFKIGAEKEFPIFNLGDGIQSIIILTFPLFAQADVENFIFIEEPELFLHPGMQRIFIETLREFPNTQAFITTHSNHLLDLSIENSQNISVFSINKTNADQNKSFEIRTITEPSFEVLDLLGVKNSSVFLTNCTIWIEGISERLYFRKFLEMYQNENPDNIENFKRYKEDINYSFIEYSGANIAHWSFLENSDENFPNINYSSISNRIFLITDRDTGKQLRHSKLQKSLGDNYYCLDCLEIENLLTPKVLKETLKAFKRKGVDNVSFLKEYSYSDYKDKPIAEFIYEIVSLDDIVKLASISDENKTGKIYNKSQFTKTAVRNLNIWSDLSEESKCITRLIYKFIEKNN